jgi:hypothetical protein
MMAKTPRIVALFGLCCKTGAIFSVLHRLAQRRIDELADERGGAAR